MSGAASPARPVRRVVAHLSDPHVLWAPGRRPPWWTFLNKRVLGGLNLLLKRRHPVAQFEAALDDIAADPPDALVVTGDLSNLAYAAEFERARDLLLGCGVPPERVVVIPGNHDAYTRGSVRRRAFERGLAPFLAAEPVRWPRFLLLDEILLAATSSAVPTPWFTAYGRLGAEQLEALREGLAAPATARVVLVHHPPLQANGRPDHRWRGNRDGARLLELCHEAGVDLLLCGHTHRRFQYRTPEGLRIVCAGSVTQPPRALGEAGTYHRYIFEGGRPTAIETRAFDPERRAFCAYEGIVLGAGAS